MDPLSFGFLALVFLIGGLIAWLADGLGRKLGKQRRSLFGLRPRHTATLLTIGAGVVIPMVTTAVLWGVSSDFRQWVIEGRAAIARSKTLQKQVTELEKVRTTLTADLAALNTRMKQSQVDAKKLQEQASKSLAEARAAEGRAQTAQRNVARLDGQLKKQSASLRGVQARLTTLGTTLRSLERTRTELERSFDIQRADLQASYDHNRLLNEENSRLSGTNEGLKSTIAGLERQQDELETSISRAQEDLTRAKQEIERVLLELDGKNAELASAEAALAQTFDQLNTNVMNSRMQPLIFRYGEELARISLPANLLPAEATSSLKRLILSASIAADARGARPTNQLQNGLSAGLFARTTDDGRTISIEEQENLISEAIANQKEEIVIVAYSSLNAFSGEYVALSVRPYRNPIVFKQNETIVEGRIDGSQSETTILSALTQFLESNVTEEAMKRGMIPRQHTESPFGRVSSERVLSLVKLISEAGRMVRVTAVAQELTRAADPLRLDFKLR
ncbi:MAG TPA: DUF3084 domain-containing protein [Fimbriimonadaceae bacterium]|nr:DUF3084 domain-containing protein [Fimbriimonadaceae bacterium]